MKIAIVNSVAGVSSKALADYLRLSGSQVDVFKPNKVGRYDYSEYNHVFNYGYGGPLRYHSVVNKPEAVLRCVDKPSSFRAFKEAGVDTVEHVSSRSDIPKHWKWVVVRDEANGRKAEGLAYYENIPGEVPEGALFSEYYDHRYEYRVVVFMNKVVGYYYKRNKPDGMWYFMVQPKDGFEKMGRQCIKAAKALGIDYVGFDVVAKDKNHFKILEANSAAIMTDESKAAIYNHYFN